MKKTRFTETQIVSILKQHEADRVQRSYAGNTVFLLGLFTTGRVNMEVWKLQM